MRKIFLLTILHLIICSKIFAVSPYCEEEIDTFGDGTGRDLISDSCIQKVKDSGNKKTIKKSLDEKIVIYGFRNMIVIENPDSKMKGQNIIAGKYTELNHIQSLFFDEKNREIIILQKSGDILFFSSVITGNVAPLRVIRNKELEGAVDLVLNSKNGELIVLNKEKKEFQFYKRSGNIHAPEKKRNTEMLRAVENIKGDYLKFDIEKQMVYSIDAENGTTVSLILEKN